MIKVTIKDRDALAEITAEGAVKWLIKHKWTMHTNEKVENNIILGHFFYKTIGDNVTTVMVPLNSERKDYPGQMAELLFKVETTENKSQLEIWAEMASYKLVLKKRPPRKDKRKDTSIKVQTGFARVGVNSGKF